MDIQENARAAATGARIGDALAMPAHWFYDPYELVDTFGRVNNYLSPPKSHPGSILWRSRYEPTEPEFDILGDQRVYWGRRGVHYHQHLRAGENTINVKLLNIALSLIDELGDYDRTEYLTRYQDFLLRPADHRDTYLEECHRGFFENLKRGIPASRAAVSEKHIGGMVPVVPLYARLRALGHDHKTAATAVHEHVSVTHTGRLIQTAVDTLLVVSREIIEGRVEDSGHGGLLSAVLTAHLERQDLEFLRGPIARIARAEKPSQVIGRRYSPACYLDGAMPAVFYLALRYADHPREGLVENVMVGGDNCHRGAVLGALFGLASGFTAFPNGWIDGLAVNPDAA